LLFDFLRDTQLVFRWDDGVFTAIAEQLLDELSNVATGYGDMLDARSNDISLSLKNKGFVTQ